MSLVLLTAGLVALTVAAADAWRQRQRERIELCRRHLAGREAALHRVLSLLDEARPG